jgi:hypothetical protein
VRNDSLKRIHNITGSIIGFPREEIARSNERSIFAGKLKALKMENAQLHLQNQQLRAMMKIKEMSVRSYLSFAEFS